MTEYCTYFLLKIHGHFKELQKLYKSRPSGTFWLKSFSNDIRLKFNTHFLESKLLCLTIRYFLFHIFCRIKKSNEWNEIQGKIEVFWIHYKMELSRNHDSYPFRSCINSKLVTLKRLQPDSRFLSSYLWSIVTSKVLKLQCSVRAQMTDISKLFETIMDFKGLSFLVTEQSLIKNQRPVFFFAIVTVLTDRWTGGQMYR